MYGGSGYYLKKIWRFRHANNAILSNIFLYFPDYVLIFIPCQISGYIIYFTGRSGQGLEIRIVPRKPGYLAGLS